jgi:hypothetical protein
LAIRDPFRHVRSDLAECIGKVDSNECKGTRQQQPVARSVGGRLAVIRMGLHILQAAIQIRQHLGEFFSSHNIASSWSIESFRDGLKIEIVAEILLDVIG